MSRFRPACPAEFKRRTVDLVRAGRTPAELSREFEPRPESIANRVRRADRDDRRRSGGAASADLEEWRV